MIVLFSLQIKIQIRLTFWQSPHGDYDHIGEVKNLIENLKINKVIINKGNISNLEKNIIKILDNKKYHIIKM